MFEFFLATFLIGMGAGAVTTVWVIWAVLDRGKHD